MARTGVPPRRLCNGLASGADYTAITIGLRCYQLWEAGIMLGMAAGVVGHARLGQEATRRDKAVDPPFWQLVPTAIESGELWEKLQFAVRQMVVDPPCHRLP